MDNEKTFRTKTGFCHILPDKIVLTRDGIIGNVAKVALGTDNTRILVLYGVLALGLFYLAFNSYRAGLPGQTLLLGFLGIYLVYGIVKSIDHSAAPIIDRNKIKTVVFRKAIYGLTRSGFEVLFEDEHGKIKKRLILLPGSLSDGQHETEKAVKIMSDEKLITKP